MFTRMQAVRWAELWLSCWNDGDFETLRALHRDGTRFEISLVDAFKRHWATMPHGIHSVRCRLDRVAWDPDTREMAIVYITDFDGTRVRGCDLITLDADGRVVSGQPCVGTIVGDDLPDRPGASSLTD